MSAAVGEAIANPDIMDANIDQPVTAAVPEQQTVTEEKSADDTEDTKMSNQTIEQTQHKSHQKPLFDPSLLPETNDPETIRKQVEFYFCDSNLRFDKFLFGMVTKENKWVPLKLVASFKRMQRFKDFAAIQSALETSELLELNENKTQIRRKVPLHIPADYMELQNFKEDVQARSLYAKGFGDETPTTQYDVEKLFEPYGVSSVRLRREDGSNVFKGSVFVEFENKEKLDAFLALDPKPKYLDNIDLIYLSKTAYVEMKIQDIKDGKVVPKDRKKKGTYGFDAFYEGKAPHGKSNNHNEKKQNGHGGHGGQRGGHRGRGGRGRGNRGGRGGNRGGRDRDNHGNRNAGAQTDGPATSTNGIPKVIATTSEEQGTKRPREDGGEGGSNQDKKLKVEASAA